ncbi:hypothetical protein, partial [Actinomadura harenae]
MLPAILLTLVGGAVAAIVITLTSYLEVRAIRQAIMAGSHDGFLLSENYLYTQFVLAGLLVGVPVLAVRSSNPVPPVLAAVASWIALRVGFALGTVLYYKGDHFSDILSSSFKHVTGRELITPVLALLVAGIGTLLGMTRTRSAAGPAMPGPGGPAAPMMGAPGAPGAAGAPGAPAAPQWGAPQPPPPGGQPFGTQPPGQPF